jgi:hypothetical protein
MLVHPLEPAIGRRFAPTVGEHDRGIWGRLKNLARTQRNIPACIRDLSVATATKIVVAKFGPAVSNQTN